MLENNNKVVDPTTMDVAQIEQIDAALAALDVENSKMEVYLKPDYSGIDMESYWG